MRDEYKTLSGETIKRELVILEADDINDPAWKKVTEVLQKNGIQVCYADGNYMNFIISEERS